MEQLPNDRYRIKDFPGRQRTRRHYSSIAPVDKINPWSADDFISEDSDEDSDRDGRLTGTSMNGLIASEAAKLQVLHIFLQSTSKEDGVLEWLLKAQQHTKRGLK
ncbi:hypothetical protein IscW_ISCW002364 [Ixodes scapularis]|uniref:Uncharacterized protein n=1 Tax=Ixodes scapularis TaxID=6945 RepID=B7PC58_IXOSC|nr:hypothetical protein IscW_ISCW002364 [Ixodes scapularis]|eukprot:XP_002409380.1 hypothetical protein IscW_ISCW002364 [Ixodes scapularis]